MERTYRTKEETIKYFEQLSYEFEKQAHKYSDEPEASAVFRAKAESYELAAFEVERNMSMKLTFDINNGGILNIEQNVHDGEILMTRTDNGVVTRAETITPGNFVTMLNWYRYQIDSGNTNLEF